MMMVRSAIPGNAHGERYSPPKECEIDLSLKSQKSCFERGRETRTVLSSRNGPVGLFGELKIRTLVFGVILEAISSRSG